MIVEVMDLVIIKFENLVLAIKQLYLKLAKAECLEKQLIKMRTIHNNYKVED